MVCASTCSVCCPTTVYCLYAVPAAKGKAAIVEEAPPRELTADELVTVEKEVKAARKSAITAAVMSVRASVGLVFAGQLPLAATAST